MKSKTAIRTSFFSIFGNLLMVIIKFLAGFFGNSYALIADAIESSADVLSSVLVWVGLKYFSKPPDENHPYGYGRYEVISNFSVIGFFFILALVIVLFSI